MTETHHWFLELGRIKISVSTRPIWGWHLLRRGQYFSFRELGLGHRFIGFSAGWLDISVLLWPVALS